MSLSLLDYPLSSQNQRVAGFEVFGDDKPRVFSTEYLPSPESISAVIEAAYRQISREQQMFSFYRQPFLESQLTAGQITVKEFVRGLLLADNYRRLNYDANNNYRFVEICIQRVLGRAAHDEREKMAWSIVLATKGYKGFVDELLNSQEYLENYGDHIVPYQRRRTLPSQVEGDVSFAHTARYGEDYRNALPRRNLSAGQEIYNTFNTRAFFGAENRGSVLRLGIAVALVLSVVLGLAFSGLL